MRRRGMRRAALVAALLTSAQAAGLAVSPGVAAAGGCAAPERIFAVNGSTGRLVELASCPDAISEVGEVDAGDWRTASRIFATGDDTVSVVYSVTADGRLEARRQSAPGAALEAPVQLDAGVDWSLALSIIVPRRGYLWVTTGGTDGGEVRAFRHEGWATGGGTLVEGPLVLSRRDGWPATGDLELTGLGAWGRAEAVFMGHHWRGWQGAPDYFYARASGAVPAWNVAGTEGGLYAVTGGAVARLKQPLYKGEPGTTYNCPANPNRWQVATSLPGDWWSWELAVPQRAAATEWPEIAPYPVYPPSRPERCPPGTDPYKWQ